MRALDLCRNNMVDLGTVLNKYTEILPERDPRLPVARMTANEVPTVISDLTDLKKRISKARHTTSVNISHRMPSDIEFAPMRARFTANTTISFHGHPSAACMNDTIQLLQERNARESEYYSVMAVVFGVATDVTKAFRKAKHLYIPGFTLTAQKELEGTVASIWDKKQGLDVQDPSHNSASPSPAEPVDEEEGIWGSDIWTAGSLVFSPLCYWQLSRHSGQAIHTYTVPTRRLAP